MVRPEIRPPVSVRKVARRIDPTKLVSSLVMESPGIEKI
jgi:hypothetical protein